MSLHHLGTGGVIVANTIFEILRVSSEKGFLSFLSCGVGASPRFRDSVFSVPWRGRKPANRVIPWEMC